jgi:hypothetical protein
MNVIELKSVKDELAEAQAECDAARTRWDANEDALIALAQEGALVTEGERRHLDARERVIAEVELQERQRDLAKQLRDALKRLRAARVAATNERLAELMPRYVSAAERVNETRDRAERLVVEFAASLIAHQEACDAETAETRGLVREAALGAPDEPSRANVVFAASDGGTVPVHVGQDGCPDEMRQRPQTRLYDGRIDQRGARLYEGLHRVAVGGRRRVASSFDNEKFVRAVERALS